MEVSGRREGYCRGAFSVSFILFFLASAVALAGPLEIALQIVVLDLWVDSSWRGLRTLGAMSGQMG